MRFTVVWSRTARDRLAELWLDTSQRAEFTAAADRIEKLLSIDPRRFAKVLGPRSFVLEIQPLIVVFSFSEQDRRVVVEEIRELGPLKSDGE